MKNLRLIVVFVAALSAHSLFATKFLDAVRARDLEKVRYYLDIKSMFKKTPVYSGMIFDDEVSEALLEAAWEGCLDIVTVLLKEGADVNRSGLCRETALHIAASRNDLAIAQKLLNKQAKVDIRDNSGQTARDIAQEMGHLEIVNAIDALHVARICP